MNRSLVAAATITAASFALAGPLDPPPGAVSPTMKTLDQVEPRTPIESLAGDATSVHVIIKPGSYYLTGNLTGVAAKAGIRVNADNVSIDLCGFALIGVPGSTDGVSVVDGKKFVVVRNGTVKSWGGAGGGAGVKLGSSCSAESLIVSGTLSGFGISAGTYSTITNCIAEANQVGGISAQQGCSISGCTASKNTGDGITVGSGGTATNCAATANKQSGFSSAGSVTFDACIATDNSVDGFNAAVGGVFRACFARNNTGYGIFGAVASTVEGCSAYGNGAGIRVGSGATVSGCTSSWNSGDGIQFGGECRIEHNCCDSNGTSEDGAGLHGTLSDNRIDSNTCTDNDIGIDIDQSGNLIVRNAVSGNATNWDIVANNKVGPIVLAPNSVAISGDTGGAGVGSTNPWANFTY